MSALLTRGGSQVARWLSPGGWPVRPALVLCLLTGVASGLAATPAGELETRIKARITEAILQQYSGATRENLNIRLDLPTVASTLETCSDAVQVDASRDRWVGRIRLSVQCEDSPGWRFNTSAEASLTLPVAVLKSSLPRNHVLSGTDIAFRPEDVSGLRQGYFLSPEALIGAALVRNLDQGHVLSNRTIEVPPMIQRGDRVSIVASGNGFSVSMRGEALSDGVRGRQIRVRNSSSDRIIRGWVIDRGIVEISTGHGSGALPATR